MRITTHEAGPEAPRLTSLSGEAWLAALAEASTLAEAAGLAPHVHDVVTQALDAWIAARGLWGEARGLRERTLSSKARAVRAAHPDVAKRVQALDDASPARGFGVTDHAAAARFLAAARALLEVVDALASPWTSYAPAGFDVVNAVSVETPRGYLSLQLAHAHAALVPCDLLVLSGSTSRAAPGGDVAACLKAVYGHRLGYGTELLRFGEGAWSCFQELPAGLPCRNVLFVRLDEPADGEPLMDLLDRLLRGARASLAALEALGHRFTTVAMPILQAHRAGSPQGMELLMGALIRHAVAWLRRSEHTTLVNVCLDHGDKLELWTQAMNGTLGRTVIAGGQDAVVEALAREVSHLANAHRAGLLASAAAPLTQLLGRMDRTTVEQIGVEGRKLAELIVGHLLRSAGRKQTAELMKDIETARESVRLAPWVVSYLHTLRIFGNEGVHARLDGRDYRPNRLDGADLVTALAAIRALFRLWGDLECSAGAGAGQLAGPRA